MRVDAQTARAGKPDDLCVRCRLSKVDRKKSKSLCLWCRLGDLIEPADRAAALEVPVVDAMVDEYEAGATCSEIGSRWGVSEETVRRRLVRVGVSMRRDTGTWEAEVIRDDAGGRLCPDCLVNKLWKKDPHGPGRYPARCAVCKARRAA